MSCAIFEDCIYMDIILLKKEKIFMAYLKLKFH